MGDRPYFMFAWLACFAVEKKLTANDTKERSADPEHRRHVLSIVLDDRPSEMDDRQDACPTWMIVVPRLLARGRGTDSFLKRSVVHLVEILRTGEAAFLHTCEACTDHITFASFHGSR